MVNKYDNYELRKVTSLEKVPRTIKDGDGYIWDPSELPDKDFDDSKVPLNYRRLAIWMRSKLFGKDVRETIARLAEMFGLNFKELMASFESLDNRQDTLETKTAQSVAKMEADKNAVIANATVDSEVILARGGKGTLGQRLDETDAQLAHIADDNAASPDDFEGDDFEKIQQALDALSDDKSSVRFSRMYDITGKGALQLKLNHVDRRSIYLIGVGGGIRKDDAGDVFSSPEWKTGDVVTSNMRFDSVEGAGTRIFDGDKIIRLTDFGSSFRNVDTIIGSPTYIQSVYLNSSSIVGGEGYATSFTAAYDVNFNTILVEHRDSFMKQVYSTADDTTIFKLTIRDSLIEGLEEKAISIGGKVTLMTVDGLYTEANKEGDIYFEDTSYINVLNINNISSSMGTNEAPKPGIKFSGKHENVSIDNTVFMGVNNLGIDLTSLTTGWNNIKLRNVRHLSKTIPYIPEDSNKVMTESSLPRYRVLTNPRNYTIQKFSMGVFDKVVGSVDLFWNGNGYHERIFDIGHAIKNDDIIGIQVHYYESTAKDVTIAHVGRTADGKLLVKINNNSGNSTVALRLDLSILTSVINRTAGGVKA